MLSVPAPQSTHPVLSLLGTDSLPHVLHHPLLPPLTFAASSAPTQPSGADGSTQVCGVALDLTLASPQVEQSGLPLLASRPQSTQAVRASLGIWPTVLQLTHLLFVPGLVYSSPVHPPTAVGATHVPGASEDSTRSPSGEPWRPLSEQSADALLHCTQPEMVDVPAVRALMGTRPSPHFVHTGTALLGRVRMK